MKRERDAQTAVIWTFLALLSALAWAPAVRAQTGADIAAGILPADTTPTISPETMARVRRALFIIEGEAPDSFFASLGAAGRDALLSIVRTEPALGLRRRAIVALRHYPDVRTRAFLERIASDPAEDAIASRYALRSLAMAFHEDAFDTVSHALLDARPLVREGAVLALALIDRARAAPLLSLLLSGERVAFVRQTIERTLSTAR